MTVSEIQELINFLPELLIYLCPGYLTLWVYNAVIARSIKESKHMLGKAIILSYIYLKGVEWLKGYVPSLDINVTIIIIAIVFGIWTDKFIKSNFYQQILCMLNISASTDIDIIDKIRTPNGVWVKVYLDSIHRVYEGALIYDIMDPEVERHIILCSYLKYKILESTVAVDADNDIFTELELIENFRDDQAKRIVLKYDSITRIEVV